MNEPRRVQARRGFFLVALRRNVHRLRRGEADALPAVPPLA
jgi:hypothetical protein